MNKSEDNEKIEFLDLVDINETKSSGILKEQEESAEVSAKENAEVKAELSAKENAEVNANEDTEVNVKESTEENTEEQLEINNKKINEKNRKIFKKKFKERNSAKKNKVIIYIRRTLITLLLTIVILLGGLYSVMGMLVHGPSPTAKNLFVMSVKETSAIGFLANWFLSEEQVQEIMDRNSIKDTDEVTNTKLVEVGATGTTSVENAEMPAIQIVDIKGGTYKGKLMIIKDPSTVFVGTVPTFTEGDGLLVSDMARNNNAIGGINGGEFVDGDITYTGMPIGLVMTKGNIINGDKSKVYHVTGLTKDNILVVGNITGQQAIDMKMRDCVSIKNSIGPFLIINGVAQEIADDGTGGGLNPRSAIGQRADGAILLLVTDGRQVNTFGASFLDLINVLQKYGAVNASAMDGGTSTQMYYDGKVINVPYSPTGPRRCPTSFLVGGIN